MVGATGFEPAASWSRTKRATKLRYAPSYNANKKYIITIKIFSQAKMSMMRQHPVD